MASRAVRPSLSLLPPVSAWLRAVRAGLVGVPIGLAMLALFCLANYLSLGRDLPAARAHVQEAFASGALQDQDWLPGDTERGWHQYNDCLILWQAIDQRASAAELTVSPMLDPPPEGRTRCNRLRGFVNGEAPPARYFYHRYIHGHTMLARFLLPSFSVETIRTIYRTALTLIVLAGLGLGLLGLARRRRVAESLFWLIVFAAFGRWFGLESFGPSLGHAPADAVNLGYLLWLAWASLRGGVSRRTAVLSAALFGCLVAIFEFLTGGIPLGLAAVIGALPLALRDEDRENLFAPVAAALCACCAAVLTCLLAKAALALIVFGPQSLIDTAQQLEMRAGLGPLAGETAGLGPLDMLKKLVKGLNGLAPGMALMAGAMIIASAAAMIWSARRLIAGGDPRLRQIAIAVLLSNLAIVAMLALLWQHTVVHAWFMERVFAWTIGSGFGLFALACLRQRRGEASPGVA